MVMLKKIICLAAVFCLTFVFSISVNGAGINKHEKKILNWFSKTVIFDGAAYKLPLNYINQMEGFFNTIDMSKEQAEEITEYLDKALEAVRDDGGMPFSGLNPETKRTVMHYGQKAVSVLDLTLVAYQQTFLTGYLVTILDKDGKVAFQASAELSFRGEYSDDVIKPTGSTDSHPYKVLAAGIFGAVFAACGGILLQKRRFRQCE